MKYIMTKDGRIEKIDEQDHGRYASLYSFIKREADTIEELCDVLVAKDGEKVLEYFTPALDKLGIARNNYKTHGHEVYGALWIDNHLVYVAKMNGEGELELLWPGI